MNHREWSHHIDAAVSLGYHGTAWDTASPLSATIYVNHSMQCLEELDNLNSDLPVRAYAWGLDVAGRLDLADSPFVSMAGAGGVGGLLCMATAESGKVGTYQMTYDGNGNIVKLLNASGAQMVLYRYGPFGEDLLYIPHYLDNPYRFSTKFNETALDGNNDGPPELYDYGFRWYHAGLGRWTARDPIGEVGGLLLYSFISNRPINKIDIHGMCSIDIHDVSDFIAGAGDSLTFGLTRQARKGVEWLLYGDFVDPVNIGSDAYFWGEVTEVVVEITVTAGGASLRHSARATYRSYKMAGKVPRKELVGTAIEQYRVEKGLVGGVVHHANPIKGHPAGLGLPMQECARYPLPFRWATQGKWNFIWVPDLATHLAHHKWMRQLEAIDRLRESTIFVRQAGNEIALYLEGARYADWSVGISATVSSRLTSEGIPPTPIFPAAIAGAEIKEAGIVYP